MQPIPQLSLSTTTTTLKHQRCKSKRICSPSIATKIVQSTQRRTFRQWHFLKAYAIKIHTSPIKSQPSRWHRLSEWCARVRWQEKSTWSEAAMPATWRLRLWWVKWANSLNDTWLRLTQAMMNKCHVRSQFHLLWACSRYRNSMNWRSLIQSHFAVTQLDRRSLSLASIPSVKSQVERLSRKNRTRSHQSCRSVCAVTD